MMILLLFLFFNIYISHLFFDYLLFLLLFFYEMLTIDNIHRI